MPLEPITTGVATGKAIIAVILSKKLLAMTGGALPFFVMAANGNGGTSPQLLTVRIIEAVIIAVVAGVISAGAAAYTTMVALQADLHHIVEKVTVIDARQQAFEERVEAVLWRPVIPPGVDFHEMPKPRR